MKRFIAISLGALVLLAPISCRRDSLTPEEARDALRKEVAFTATVDGYQVAKAADAAFESGDAIGIYAFDVVNRKATAQGSSVVPSTPIQWELVRTATFLAYYPYDASLAADPKISFSVKEDQSSAANYRASDLRVALAEGKNGETVVLPFKHMLSKLIVKVSCKDASEKVQSVTLGSVATTIGADITAQTVETASGSKTIKACADGSNYVAILVPQTMSGVLSITFVTNKGKYVYKSSSPLNFQSGYAYETSAITVPGSQPFSVSITDWDDGGSMDFHKGKLTE